MFLYKNKENLKRIFLANKFSTSKFFSLADFDFKFTDNLKRLYFSGNHILNVDLSNFTILSIHTVSLG